MQTQSKAAIGRPHHNITAIYKTRGGQSQLFLAIHRSCQHEHADCPYSLSCTASQKHCPVQGRGHFIICTKFLPWGFTAACFDSSASGTQSVGRAVDEGRFDLPSALPLSSTARCLSTRRLLRSFIFSSRNGRRSNCSQRRPGRRCQAVSSGQEELLWRGRSESLQLRLGHTALS